MLKTCGQAVLHVNFDAVKYRGIFHVLPGSVPLILGMSFLGEVSPSVDWKRKLVFKNGKCFHVTSIARPRAVAHVSDSTLVQNSFGALEADCALDDGVCVATPCDDDDVGYDNDIVVDVVRTPRVAV